jgi:type I restriction enzyme, S subunit
MAGDAHRTTVGDYVTLVRGTTYKGALVGKPGPALLGLGSIEPGGGFRIGNFKTYGGDCPEELMLFPGDIYASLKGATKDGKMIGSVARVPPSVPTGRLTQDTVKLVFRDRDPLTATYLYWVLRTPQYRNYCAGHAMGSAVVALSRSDFLSYSVPAPTTQRRMVVAFLDAIEEKIELNRRMNETLEAMGRALFKSWFVDFDPVRATVEGRAPGLPQPIADLFPDSFGESELGEIPRGWSAISLYSIGKFINGAAYAAFRPNDERCGLPIIKIAELKAGITAQTRFSDVLMPEKYRIADSDILLSWSGNPDTSIDTFVWSGGAAWLNQHIFRVLPLHPSERAFVLSTLKSLRPVFAEIARNKQTTGLGHVTAEDMKRLLVARPDDRLLLAWSKVASPMHERTYQNSLGIGHLSKIRDTLLPKLISGELRVKDAERYCDMAEA